MNGLSIQIVILGILSLGAIAQTQQDLPEDHLTKDHLERQLRFLASDELMGRNTGSREIRLAAEYIADYFRSLELLEFPEAPGYLQPVPLRLINPPRHSELVIGKRNFRHKIDFIVRGGKKITLNAPLVYAGYGVWDEKKGNSDFDGLDLKGKIVVTHVGSEERSGFSELFTLSEEKKKMVRKLGGLALVELYDMRFPWKQMASMLSRSRLEPDDPGTDSEDGELPHFWLSFPGGDFLAEITDDNADTARISSDGLQQDRIRDNNVVGYIRGTDPQLANEYILLTAHYDHIGAGMNIGRGATPEDTIFNGAGDNAMGTVALMGAAKALSVKPPRRPVIFLAVTGEEKGMLGSSYFARHPPVPLHHIVFNLNNDGAGMTEPDIITVLGYNRSNVSGQLLNACRLFGLKIFTDPAFEFLFHASDNISFASQGIPALTFSPGIREFNLETPPHYHRASDEAEMVDYEYFILFVKAFARAARNIADMETKPEWTTGDEFEPAGRILYNREE